MARAAKAIAPLLRDIAMALPEVTEAPHFEATSFRVRGKIFATSGEKPGAEEGVLKLAPEIQQAMIEERPDAFRPAAGVWGHRGWTHVRMLNIPRRTLKDLTISAWAHVAPKTLVAAHAARLKRA